MRNGDSNSERHDLDNRFDRDIEREPTLLSCRQDHIALKGSAEWAGLELVGIQHTPADDIGPAEDLELRNCSCGSTLAKVVEIGGAR